MLEDPSLLVQASFPPDGLSTSLTFPLFDPPFTFLDERHHGTSLTTPIPRRHMGSLTPLLTNTSTISQASPSHPASEFLAILDSLSSPSNKAAHRI